MTERRFRAAWLHSMIGSVFALARTRNAMWRVSSSLSTINAGIVGFYSFSSFTLAIGDLPPEHAKRLPRYDAISAALMGRLARDKKVRGEGVGDLLLADAVPRVIGAARSLAVFAIVVEATDGKAAAFYRNFNSCHFRTARSRLFMPASEAAEAVSRAMSR